MKNTLGLIVFILVLVALTAIFFLNGRNTEVTLDEIFYVSAQGVEDQITIDRVVMDQPGFIVAREILDGKPGQIVEVSKYLKAGENIDVVIDLAQPLIEGVGVSSDQFDQEIVVAVYYDDGDKGFNPSLDSLAYREGEVLARFVKTGIMAPESAVVPNTKGENIDVAQIVTYTDSGFIPRNSEISPGDTVRFINKSSDPMWVASNEHAAHMTLPTFDQFSASSYGESYEYTFEKEGVWEYHDHINASQIGTILVHSN